MVTIAVTITVSVSMGVVTGSAVDVGTETVVVRNVGHVSPATIRFTEGVVSLDVFTITVLRSLFHISSVVIIDSISILVLGMSLWVCKEFGSMTYKCFKLIKSVFSFLHSSPDPIHDRVRDHHHGHIRVHERILHSHMRCRQEGTSEKSHIPKLVILGDYETKYTVITCNNSLKQGRF